MNREETIRKLLDLQHDIGALVHALKNDAGDAPASDKSYFDPSNPTHLAEVNKLFDQYQLSEKRRGYFLNHALQGVRMLNVADEIDRQVKIYEERYPGATKVYANRANGRRH